MALQFDCPRSSFLAYEFPLPIYYQGHTTGSTVSGWGEKWTTLYYWQPDQVAAAFLQYWGSTVPPNDKDEPIAFRWHTELHITQLRNRLRPSTDEAHVRRHFDTGISWAHRTAISDDGYQRPPTDPHSTIELYENIVFGEPDYLLQNPTSLRVTGVCEAKSPWNIGPSEIDDVISGSNTR